MFQLTLIDHIRLSFAGVLSAHDGHADAAARLARWAWYSKVAMLVILALSAAATLVAQFVGGSFRVVGIDERGARVRDLGDLRRGRSRTTSVRASCHRREALAALREISRAADRDSRRASGRSRDDGAS